MNSQGERAEGPGAPVLFDDLRNPKTVPEAFRGRGQTLVRGKARQGLVEAQIHIHFGQGDRVAKRNQLRGAFGRLEARRAGS